MTAAALIVALWRQPISAAMQDKVSCDGQNIAYYAQTVVGRSIAASRVEMFMAGHAMNPSMGARFRHPWRKTVQP